MRTPPREQRYVSPITQGTTSTGARSDVSYGQTGEGESLGDMFQRLSKQMEDLVKLTSERDEIHQQRIADMKNMRQLVESAERRIKGEESTDSHDAPVIEKEARHKANQHERQRKKKPKMVDRATQSDESSFSSNENLSNIHSGASASTSIRETRAPEATTINALPGIRLQHGGWLTNPFADLKFTGRTDKQTPLRFLEKFQRTADYEEIPDSERIYFFGKCMTAQAADWWELQNYATHADAIQGFKTFYWSDETQSQNREFLYTGKYKQQINRPMSDYAIRIAREAKLLQPPMSDHEIFRCLKRHFSHDIARELRPSFVRTIEDMCRLLDEIEADKKQNEQRQKQREISKKTAKTKSVNEASTSRPAAASKEKQRSGQRGNYERRGGYSQDTSQRRDNWRSGNSRNFYNEKSTGTNYGANTEKFTEPQRKENAEGDSTTAKKNAAKDAKEKSTFASMRTQLMLADLREEHEEARGKPSWDYTPVVNILVRGKQLRALVDTGAQISAIFQEAVKYLEKDGFKLPYIKINKFNIRGAFDERGSISSRKIQLSFKLDEENYTYEFYEVTRLVSPVMVLGMDFLAKNRVHLECSDQDVFIVQNYSNEKPRAKRVCAMKTQRTQQRLENLLHRYEALLDGTLGRAKHYRHTILMNDKKPHKSRVYPIAKKHVTRSGLYS